MKTPANAEDATVRSISVKPTACQSTGKHRNDHGPKAAVAAQNNMDAAAVKTTATLTKAAAAPSKNKVSNLKEAVTEPLDVVHGHQRGCCTIEYRSRQLNKGSVGTTFET